MSTQTLSLQSFECANYGFLALGYLILNDRMKGRVRLCVWQANATFLVILLCLGDSALLVQA